MNHFVVSARKYRPETFEEVVGQKAVTNTLKNAIENNHLAQALLFTGPRGVGKTSCARILAKTVNKVSGADISDFAFNIFELDAASNNSVEDIRSLNDQVRIPPQTGDYKVYIIDEVHMLSASAFNAFLKTLEEPPKHAIFILATTEKHKIIPTILSRCQVFDFKRITVQDIKEHLKDIASKEGVVAEDEALHIIAQKSDGAMRDALSTYDRVVSYCGNHLTRKAVAENLNVLDFETFLEVTDLLLHKDIPGVLLYFNAVLAKGYDGQHFIGGLATHFRDLLVCKNPSTLELLDVSENSKQAYKKQASSIDNQQLLEFIDLANNCDFNYKMSQNKLLHVELCLMKLASFGSAQVQKKKPEQIISANSSTLTSNNSNSKVDLTENKFSNQESEGLVNEPNSIQQKQETVNEKVDKPTQNQRKDTAAEVETKTEKENQPTKNHLPKKKNGLSLKSIQYKKNHEKKLSENENTEEIIDEDFSLEELKSAWIKLSEIMDKKGEKLLASTLLSDIPKLNGKTIELNMPNETMKIELMHNKSRILSYLSNTLKNNCLDINIKVSASQEKKYIHTSQEKYRHFVELNPKVEELKQKLDLDF
jgi:DNA polymerase-3 subunit gamma/tau